MRVILIGKKDETVEINQQHLQLIHQKKKYGEPLDLIDQYSGIGCYEKGTYECFCLQIEVLVDRIDEQTKQDAKFATKLQE